MKYGALLIVTLLAVLGCNKSEPTPSQAPEQSFAPPPARAPEPAVDRPQLVVLGDSLAEGFGSEPGKSFPDFLQQKLDTAGYRYQVVNMGISGDTTTGGLSRIESAVALRPEIVILELGGNDGLRGVPVAQTRSNLEAMIRRLQEAKIRVVLAGMSLPPNYGEQYVQSFETMYRELAREYKLTLIPFLFEDILKRIAKDPALMQRDGIHPSASGHEVMAGTVMRYLGPVLRKS